MIDSKWKISLIHSPHVLADVEMQNGDYLFYLFCNDIGTSYIWHFLLYIKSEQESQLRRDFPTYEDAEHFLKGNKYL